MPLGEELEKLWNYALPLGKWLASCHLLEIIGLRKHSMCFG